MRYLLDVNVLVALGFTGHASHQQAREWFESEPNRLWATCALTQGGFLRVLPRLLGNQHQSVRQALEILQQNCQNQGHEYWDTKIDLIELGEGLRVRLTGVKQVTDLQLVLVAHQYGGQLATFDSGIKELVIGTKYAGSVVMV